MTMNLLYSVAICPHIGPWQFNAATFKADRKCQICSSRLKPRLGVARTPSSPTGGIVIDSAAPPGGKGIAGGGGGGAGSEMGGGATFTGAGAQAATAATMMMTARFFMPRRICSISDLLFLIPTGFSLE
jgi:hypothetical protein